MSEFHITKRAGHMFHVNWQVNPKKWQIVTDVSTKRVYFSIFSPRRCRSNSKRAISKHVLRIKCMCSSFDTALRWMPQYTFTDKSTLVQVMAWYLKKQVLARINVDLDLCRHMASLRHSVLKGNVFSKSELLLHKTVLEVMIKLVQYWSSSEIYK